MGSGDPNAPTLNLFLWKKMPIYIEIDNIFCHMYVFFFTKIFFFLINIYKNKNLHVIRYFLFFLWNTCDKILKLITYFVTCKFF